MGRLASLVLLTGAVALFPATSRAEESAKDLFEKGTAAYALGHFDEAATDYEKAFSLKPDPALLFNAAQAHRQAGNKRRALSLYQSYVKLYGSRVGNRAEVERIIASLKKAIESDQQASQTPPTETTMPEHEYGPGREPAPPPPVATTTAPATTATAARPELTQSAPPEKPLVKRPWFWAVVGGAVVVVAVGVGLGVGLGTAAHDPKASLGALKVN